MSLPEAGDSLSNSANRHAQDRTPLRSVLGFTFLNSLGSAILTNGLYFLARERFGFDDRALFILGVLWGIMYIPGALAVGPILRRLPKSGPLCTHRGFLGFLMLGLGLCSLIAAGAAYWAGEGRGAWTIWFLVVVYSPLSGMLWPVVESYVSGGRSGPGLRAAIGRFNITWSSSLVVSTVGMAPFVERAPLGVWAALGLVHLGCIGILRTFQSRPGAHGDDHEPHPPVYVGLLSFCRVALPLAFMFVAALMPYLPRATSELGVQPTWGVALVGVWLAARVASFIVLERWDGWHGRWWLPLAGLGVLLAGFAVVVVAPLVLAPAGGLVAFLAGLLAFGVGVGVIYSAALYYAMSVGSAEVDAGGMHETLIGIGYTTGPLCGLIAVVLTQQRVVTEIPHGTLMLLFTAGLALLFTAWALRRALVLTRDLRQQRRQAKGTQLFPGEPAATTFVPPRR